MGFKKSTTEQEILDLLEAGRLQFSPLELGGVRTRQKLSGSEVDALFELRWGQKTYRFAAEVKGLSTPKVVETAINQARKYSVLAEAYPMILVPYLDRERLANLETQGISGIDLCGNGIVIVPGELLVMRTGFPNKFRGETAIKNIYRKNSSIASRVFLLVPRFDSVKAAVEEIQQRGGEVTNATVSKVCASLEDDLIIERSRGETTAARRLQLLQPEKLLDFLARNYVPPEVTRMFRGKYASPDELCERLIKAETANRAKTVLTGTSSVDAYAVMAREPMKSFYCTDLAKILASLGGDIRETDHFANVAIQETRDNFVYFDRRPGLIASPIQSYLELFKGDGREQQTAVQVRRLILDQLARRAAAEK